MRIIKFKIIPVPVHLHSGYGKLTDVIISPFFGIFKNIVHNLESGLTPVTRRLTRLQTMHNVFKYIKAFLKRLRVGCSIFFNLLMVSTVALDQMYNQSMS